MKNETKNHYIDKVNVIVDGENWEIKTISGTGYNPDFVKKQAISMAKESFPNAKNIAAVILEHTFVNLAEFKSITGQTPPGLDILDE